MMPPEEREEYLKHWKETHLARDPANPTTHLMDDLLACFDALPEFRADDPAPIPQPVTW